MTARRPDRADLTISAGTWLLASGLLALAPALSAADSTLRAPEPASASWWLGLLLVTAQSALLGWARIAPRAVLPGAAAAAPLAALAGLNDALGVTTVAIAVAAFLAVLTRPLTALSPSLAGAAALMGGGALIVAAEVGDPWPEAVGGAALQSLGTLALVVLVATLVTSRREARSARAGQAQARAREQEALVQAAIARERTAMARELHDIAAHHLSGITVMTAAIGTQIDTDPAAAKAATQQVRQQSVAVLRDLRSLVGLLREGGPAGDARPENLAGIAALVRDRSATGRSVELTVLGGDLLDAGVGPLAQLAAYRIVQESLANAVRHATGAAVAVVVDGRSEEQVLITVRNGPPAVPPAGPPAGDSDESGGFGLIGMRERAELTGAHVEAGPTEDDGWLVTLRLPRDTRPAPFGEAS